MIELPYMHVHVHACGCCYDEDMSITVGRVIGNNLTYYSTRFTTSDALHRGGFRES